MKTDESQVTGAARFRIGCEVDRAREAVHMIADLQARMQRTPLSDPLCQAYGTAAQALLLALHSSPVLEITRPVTVVEAALPSVDDALERAQRDSARRQLFETFAKAFGQTTSATTERKAVVSAVLRAAHQLLGQHALARGTSNRDDLLNVNIRDLIETEAASERLAAFCASMPYLSTITWSVGAYHSGVYGTTLPGNELTIAIIACARHEARGFVGRPKGLGQLQALRRLLVAAGIEPGEGEALSNDAAEARAEIKDSAVLQELPELPRPDKIMGSCRDPIVDSGDERKAADHESDAASGSPS